MNDKKLHTFRRPPDDDYTEKLYQRLTILPQVQPAPAPPNYGRNRKNRLAWTFALLLAGILIMAAVPGVRARFEDVIKQVGGLTLFMTEDFPGSDNPTIIPDEIMPLEEARERIDFDFNLPAWVPDDLILQSDEVHFSEVVDGLIIHWDSEERGRGLTMVVNEVIPDVRHIVGPDSLTEITLNGEPAAFVRGGWYSDSKEWQDTGIRSIHWQLDGIQYDMSVGSEEHGALTDEELIKIAESIAPIPTPEEETSVRP
jgi:hypothetical protein